MLVLLQMFATARKDILLVTRDSSAFATLLLMPLVFILVMSLALSNMFSSGEESPIRLLVANEDQGEMGANLLASLEQNSGFRIISAQDGVALGSDEVQTLLSRRQEQIALIIPATFSRDVRAGVFEGGAGARLELLRDPALSEQIVAPLRGAIRGLSQQAVGQGIVDEGIDAAVMQLENLGAFVPAAAREQLKTLASGNDEGSEGGFVRI